MFYLFFYSVFSGPAAFCQCSQCSVPVTLSSQHAEQSGACPATLEKAGPGTEEVCVRPPCCSQLNCPASKSYWWSKNKTNDKKKKTLWWSPWFISLPFSHLWFASHQVWCFRGGHGEEIWICRAGVPGRCLIKAGSSYLVCRQHKRLQWIDFCTILNEQS